MGFSEGTSRIFIVLWSNFGIFQDFHHSLVKFWDFSETLTHFSGFSRILINSFINFQDFSGFCRSISEFYEEFYGPVNNISGFFRIVFDSFKICQDSLVEFSGFSELSGQISGFFRITLPVNFQDLSGFFGWGRGRGIVRIFQDPFRPA